MKPLPRDTQPAIERVQIGLLRAASSARRFQLARSLSETVIRLARRALRDARPNASDDDLAVEFVRLSYGDELTSRPAAHLAQRARRATP